MQVSLFAPCRALCSFPDYPGAMRGATRDSDHYAQSDTVPNGGSLAAQDALQGWFKCLMYKGISEPLEFFREHSLAG